MSVVVQDGSPGGRCLQIVQATSSYLDAIVTIHLLTFEGFFLQSLGDRFVKELYSGFISNPSAICLVVIDGAEVIGFVVGTTQPEGFFRQLLRRRWHVFALAAATSWVRHPFRVGLKLLSALRYRGERPRGLKGAALLSSIGVAPVAAGKGIGRVLLSAFCKTAKESGALTVFLTTDRDNNDEVNRFYISNGFVVHSSFLRGWKRWMNLYTRSLLDVQSSSQEPLLR